MKIETIQHGGNKIDVRLNLEHLPEKKYYESTSPIFVCGPVGFQVRSKSMKYFENNYYKTEFVIFIKFVKVFEDDDLLYICKLSNKKFNMEAIAVNQPDLGDQWQEIYWQPENRTYSYSFDLSVQIDLRDRCNPFASLFEDSDLTDFELCGNGGSVRVHSVILAGFSPVLKTMFTGDWKETTEGQMKVPATKETLNHLKEFIYLDKLPENGIEELIILGSSYMMSDLIQKCTTKLLFNVNAGNIFQMMELASKHKLTNLAYGIFYLVQNGTVPINKELLLMNQTTHNLATE